MPGVFDIGQLQSAFWNGAAFLMEDVETTGGQKTVVHEYPNSNRRTVESLGELPDAYVVNAIIEGVDYFEKKKQLRAAIKEPGIHKFIHPYDGEVDCHVDGAYSYTESDRSLSETIITFRLLVATERVLPQAGTSSLSGIQDDADDANQTLKDGIGDIFNVSTRATGNFTAAQDLLNDAGQFFNDKRAVFVQSSETISAASNAIDNFTADINSLIGAPAELGTDLIDLFQSVRSLYTTPEERFEAMKQFFDFGDDEQTIVATTAGLTERKSNQNNIISSMKCGALVEAYRAAAEQDYGNTDDINDAQIALEDQFQDIFDETNLSDGSDLGLTDETQLALSDLRDSIRSFLDDAKLTAAQVVTVRVRNIPAQLLSFIYYGSSDNADEIISLNSITDPSFVEGNVDILSE